MHRRGASASTRRRACWGANTPATAARWETWVQTRKNYAQRGEAFTGLFGNVSLDRIWTKMSLQWNANIYEKNRHRLLAAAGGGCGVKLTPMTPLRMEHHCREHNQRIRLLLQLDDEIEMAERVQDRLYQRHMWRREYADDLPTDQRSADSRHVKDWREIGTYKITLVKTKLALMMGIRGKRTSPGRKGDSTRLSRGGYKAPAAAGMHPSTSDMPTASTPQQGAFRTY